MTYLLVMEQSFPVGNTKCGRLWVTSSPPPPGNAEEHEGIMQPDLKTEGTTTSMWATYLLARGTT